MDGYRLVARNPATASENRIHSDDVAKTYGFQGGLVPGVIVFAYMTHPVVEHFAGFLERGWLSARFLKPIYDGERIDVELDGTAVRVKKDSGETSADGEAGLHSESIAVRAYPLAPLPTEPPPANPEAFDSIDVLGSVDDRLEEAEHAAYLEILGETLPVYADEGVAHPGWLLQRANRILTSNVQLGPWIHVSSDVRFLSAFHVGETASTRGRVMQHFERKGHRFVELDVLVLAEGERPVMQANHVAIYEPRQIR